ncbi:MAG: hypothetical protein R3275_03035 [Saprospiraceae bacterium]|nr:hypothetical protein [Saprospiraceae bacterium]
MTYLRFLLIVLPFLMAVTGCSKIMDEHLLCDALDSGDRSEVAEWIEFFTHDLEPKPTNNDPLGQSDNLEALVDKLSDIDCMDADVICYACIETYPPKSEIKLTTSNRSRIIFLKTSEDYPLKFVGWRE